MLTITTTPLNRDSGGCYLIANCRQQQINTREQLCTYEDKHGKISTGDGIHWGLEAPEQGGHHGQELRSFQGRNDRELQRQPVWSDRQGQLQGRRSECGVPCSRCQQVAEELAPGDVSLGPKPLLSLHFLYCLSEQYQPRCKKHNCVTLGCCCFGFSHTLPKDRVLTGTAAKINQCYMYITGTFTPVKRTLFHTLLTFAIEGERRLIYT